MLKLVVSDLDGTLLNSKHVLSDYTKKVVRKLCERDDVEFIIATGRNYKDAQRIKADLKLNIPMITSNGAILYDKFDKRLHSYFLNKSTLDEIYQINHKKYSKDIFINIITDDRWYILETLPKDHIIYEWISDDWKFENTSLELIKDEEITKVYYIGKHDDLVNLEKELKDKVGFDVNTAFTLPFCLEIFPKDATKAKALKKLIKICDYSLEHSIAFGDGFNDAELLNEVKQGYIMKNAAEELKNCLNNIEVIDANYEDGVAKKLVQLFSLEI
ncbi:Cof-type HAD-IIB family hydrolase [Caviibacter abscessus]|uniref:Cof-type HAD-IIB family hydrolase n=1 Tax=Caviibacter abscessus TaxID=1766719 RepID=UPI00082C3C06|nr:Cof-type HAD-IIB family hydrolase [Caviibacter abscessus]